MFISNGLFLLVVRNCHPHLDITLPASQVKDLLPFDLTAAVQPPEEPQDNSTENEQDYNYVPAIPKVMVIFSISNISYCYFKYIERIYFNLFLANTQISNVKKFEYSLLFPFSVTKCSFDGLYLDL